MRLCGFVGPSILLPALLQVHSPNLLDWRVATTVLLPNDGLNWEQSLWQTGYQYTGGNTAPGSLHCQRGDVCSAAGNHLYCQCGDKRQCDIHCPAALPRSALLLLQTG